MSEGRPYGLRARLAAAKARDAARAAAARRAEVEAEARCQARAAAAAAIPAGRVAAFFARHGYVAEVVGPALVKKCRLCGGPCDGWGQCDGCTARLMAYARRRRLSGADGE